MHGAPSGGALGGAAGQAYGHEVGEALKSFDPMQASITWTEAFGTDEDRRNLRELREVDALMTGGPAPEEDSPF